MIVALEGCMGSGKSTTARLVADRLGWNLILEQAHVHPFLEAFYTDPDRYALETEIGFVLLHYHHLHSLNHQSPVLTDFSPVKDLIFARMNLTSDNLALFEHVYNDLVGRIKKPTLTVFLRVGVEELFQRINHRARPYETNIRKEYLQRLSEFYELHMDDLGQQVRVVDVTRGDSEEDVADKVYTVVKDHVERRS